MAYIISACSGSTCREKYVVDTRAWIQAHTHIHTHTRTHTHTAHAHCTRTHVLRLSRARTWAGFSTRLCMLSMRRHVSVSSGSHCNRADHLLLNKSALASDITLLLLLLLLICCCDVTA